MAEAIERAKIATRQYAKRQATWFRHQLGPQWQRVARSRMSSQILDLERYLRNSGELTCRSDSPVELSRLTLRKAAVA